MLPVGAAGLVLLATACGGGAKAPAVASLGATGSTAPTASKSPKSPARGFVEFATCMTAHGVPTQAGPNGHGVFIQGGDPGSPQFRSAQAACSKLLPGGGPPQLTPAQEATRARALASLAACMRRHGVVDFPDPTGQGELPFGAMNKLDPTSPIFRAAYKACWSLFPKVGPQIRLRPGRCSSPSPCRRSPPSPSSPPDAAVPPRRRWPRSGRPPRPRRRRADRRRVDPRRVDPRRAAAASRPASGCR